MLTLMKVRALSMVAPLCVLVLACSGADGGDQGTGENSENTGDVAQAQGINPVGNGPRKHLLTNGGVFDCGQAISIELVQCKACIDTEKHGRICTCYDCEREGDACSSAYSCTSAFYVDAGGGGLGAPKRGPRVMASP